MEIITTETINGAARVPVYHYTEIPFTRIMLESKESKKRGRYAVSYLEIPCAFDIETTNIYKRTSSGKIDSNQRPYAFMYHWQFCIGYRVIFGRTWDDFIKMLRAIEKNMNLGKGLRLVVYVHNLAFEMQFMRKFLNVTESFCKAERAPLKIVHNDAIEFRCSAALSNMSLNMFCKAENATFYKMVDSYDYRKIRTSETELTETEKGYCYNDVRGLCECIQSLMRFDTLATIPMTSTGYVRRDARIEMKKNKENRRIFRDSAVGAAEYNALRAAFRGGDTHANARYSNQIIENVTSFDIASSYPACMMCNKFPMSKFIEIKMDTFNKMRDKYPGKIAYIFHVALFNVECAADHGIPYIAYAKTKYCSRDRILDNGRVLKAAAVTLWVTDIDMEIITSEYRIGEIRLEKIYMSRYEKLPEEYRKVVLDYFVKKTTLKGLDDPESLYMYGKSKNRLNALYGMMVMRLDQTLTEYTGEGDSGYINADESDMKADPAGWLENVLEKYHKKRSNFLAYQWGVWVTSWARHRLHQMMRIIGRDLVYIDTDSVKFVNYKRHKAAIESLNNELRSDAEASGAYADDRNGIRHYMGVFEHDGDYNRLKTLGAKKYVVDINGKCYSTIAGVSKQAGQQFFNENGLDAFKIGAVIEKSGHLVAYYNDDEIHEITVKGCTMKTASNLALIDDTYTIGVTDDYLFLLDMLERAKLK